MDKKENNSDWKEAAANPVRVREGVAKMRQALEEDERKERKRGLGLPKDWRNRILK
jgi:hypothetical protein